MHTLRMPLVFAVLLLVLTPGTSLAKPRWIPVDWSWSSKPDAPVKVGAEVTTEIQFVGSADSFELTFTNTSPASLEIQRLVVDGKSVPVKPDPKDAPARGPAPKVARPTLSTVLKDLKPNEPRTVTVVVRVLGPNARVVFSGSVSSGSSKFGDSDALDYALDAPAPKGHSQTGT